MHLHGLSLYTFLVLSFMTAPVAAQTVPVFNIRPLGLPDAEHTGSAGERSSFASNLSNLGVVAGDSWRWGLEAGGWSSWVYSVTTDTYRNISQTSSEYTRADGYRDSSVWFMTQSGLAYIVAKRYDGGNTPLGQAAWVHDYAANVSRRHGFVDAEHTGPGNYQFTDIRDISPGGYVVGETSRWVNGTGAGTSQWIYNPNSNSTINVGLTDAEHTRADGYRYSRPPFYTDSLNIYSSSERYTGSTLNGETAWAYEMPTGVRTLIGMIDPEHTRNDGYRLSYYQALGHNGTVAGASFRFNGPTDAGTTSWVYLPTPRETRRVGFTDSAHTRNDGYRDSTAYVPESGMVIYGKSKRYLGASNGGQSAWTYLPTSDTTRRIGLFDASHTRADGYQYSETNWDMASDTGLIFGEAARFSGSSDRGLAAWVHETAANTNTDIGLTGTDFVRSDGYRFSFPRKVNASGQAAGISYRYSGSTLFGKSVWYYDPITKTSTDISLSGPGFTNSATGQRYSEAYDINQNGVIMGAATRYLGSVDVGDAGLVYDPATNTTTPLVFSINPLNGESYTDVEFLSPNNVVLGEYDKYDNAGNYLGTRIFYWSRDRGFGDLGDMVIGGLTENGWEAIWDWTEDNSQGMLIGEGIRLDGISDMSFLLTAVVPEPSTVLMIASALALAGWRLARRRRHRDAAIDVESSD